MPRTEQGLTILLTLHSTHFSKLDGFVRKVERLRTEAGEWARVDYEVRRGWEKPERVDERAVTVLEALKEIDKKEEKHGHKKTQEIGGRALRPTKRKAKAGTNRRRSPKHTKH